MMKKGAYLWCGITLLAVCALFTILSWMTCEPCELKMFPSLINGAFIMLSLVLIFVGLTKQDEVEIVVDEKGE
jgi:hypothetical protein